jgi:flagellar assembly protein FliH
MSKMWHRADFWPAEPMASAPIDDFALGVAEGRRTVEAELAAERDALLQLAGSLETLQAPPSALIASLIMTSVERLVSDIVGNAPIDGALLSERATALAAIIAHYGSVTLAVHPDDEKLIDTALPVVADAALARGMVQARAGAIIYEDGVPQAMVRLRTEISRMGLAS